MPEPFLPPDLAALADPPPPAVKPLSLRVDLGTLARIEALRDRLNQPSRGALLRFLLGEGLRHAEAQLQRAAAEAAAAPVVVTPHG